MDNNPSPEHHCKSCGNNFTGLYCNLCGEKIIEPKDRKFKTVLSNVLIATTFSDNKFIKSLWLTITRPGFLSREYVDGRRVNYMRPLQMFFILNLVYFLFPGILQLFNSSLHTQMYVLPHGKLAQKIVALKLKSEGISRMGFELIYNDRSVNLAKLLIVIFIILASLPLSLIFMKRNRYFSDHVALAVELTSFNLAVNALGLTFVFWVINKVLHLGHISGTYLNDLTLTVLFISTNMYFLFRAASTFYGQHGNRLFIRAILGIVGLFLALEVYRFILFFITMWMV